MRFMVIVKATEDSENGVMPSEELLAAMGRYNEELVAAGIMKAGEGLHPSSRGVRVRFSGADRSVIDGILTVSTEEATETARLLVDTEGMLCGISSGACLCAATQLAKQPAFSAATIVVLLPDTGERYLSMGLFG